METPKSTQKTVTIDQELWSALADWLETEKAKKLGYHSKAQFCTEAVRELLEYRSKNRPTEQKILEEIGLINMKMDDFYEINRKLPHEISRLVMMFNEVKIPADSKIKAVKAWKQKSKKVKLEKLLEKTSG